MQVESKQELAAGSRQECEVRAACIQAVERLRAAITALQQPAQAHTSVRDLGADIENDVDRQRNGMYTGMLAAAKTVDTGASPNGTATAEPRRQSPPLAGTESSPKQCPSIPPNVPYAVHLDWWLWEQGERRRRSDPPHHRTHTTFY